MNMLRKIIFDQARENWLAYRAARMDKPGERALSELLLNELYSMNGENFTADAPPASPTPAAAAAAETATEQPAAKSGKPPGLTPLAGLASLADAPVASVDALPRRAEQPSFSETRGAPDDAAPITRGMLGAELASPSQSYRPG